MELITNFDDVCDDLPHRGVGYHWVDPGCELATDLDDGTFYIADDIYEWAGGWMDGMKVYQITYAVRSPKVYHKAIDVYEYNERRFREESPNADAIFYTPAVETYGQSHRQAVLLDPKNQVVSIKPVDLKMFTKAVRRQTNASPDYFNHFLPIMANVKSHSDAHGVLYPEEFEMYALGPTGTLHKQNFKDILPEGESAATLLDGASTMLNTLAHRFQRQSEGFSVPHMQLQDTLKEIKPPSSIETQIKRPRKAAGLDAANDIADDRITLQYINSQLDANAALARMAGQSTLAYSDSLGWLQRHRQPMQALEVSKDNLIRFRKNQIVEAMVKNGGWEMNDLVKLGPREDYLQLCQMLGYTADGWANLSSVGSEDDVRVHAERELMIRRESDALSLNIDKRKDVPLLPAVRQKVKRKESKYFVSGDMAIALYGMLKCNPIFDICVGENPDDVTLTLNVEVDHMLTVDKHTTAFGEAELTITNDGMLTVTDGGVEVYDFWIDLELFSQRLFINAVTLPASAEVAISALFNRGLLQAGSYLRPDVFFQHMESVWRFISIRERVLELLESEACSLTDTVQVVTFNVFNGIDVDDQEAIKEWQEAFKHKPKPTCVDNIILLACHNFYHSGMETTGGKLLIEDGHFSFEADIHYLVKHINEVNA